MSDFHLRISGFCRESHLWYVLPDAVKSETLLKRYFELLSPCEKQSVLRMSGDELQKRALLSRALVRTTIARYVSASHFACASRIWLLVLFLWFKWISEHYCWILDQTNDRVDPRSLNFKKNGYGKPEVWFFSYHWCLIFVIFLSFILFLGALSNLFIVYLSR
jgi:4'-phosphopantetheinyl transferase